MTLLFIIFHICWLVDLCT